MSARQDALFPVETYVHILKFLPPSEASATALTSFLSANSVLRSAAKDPGLWEPQYRARYRHAVDDNERARHAACEGNWRLLYASRRTLDRRALLLVDEIRTIAGSPDTARQQDLASLLVREFGMDVVDALELETRVPVPRIFRRDGEDQEEEPVPDAFQRRFWAKAALGAVLRSAAVKNWREGESFEDLLGGLSTFHTVPPYYITSQLDALAADCRKALLQAAMPLDPQETGYNLLHIAIAIRKFVHSEGFGIAHDIRSFSNPLNQFPHWFLEKDNRNRILAISVVYVYVNICRRLGLEASPTDTPNVVCCYIRSAHPVGGDIFMDVTRENPPLVFANRDPVAIAALTGIPAEQVARVYFPAPNDVLVRRMVNNIRAAIMPGRGVPPEVLDDPERVVFQYAMMVAESVAPDPQPGLVFSFGDRVPSVPVEYSLDYRAVLINGLGEWESEGFVDDVQDIITENVEMFKEPRRRHGRQLDYFTGQMVGQVDGPKVGCVIGWPTETEQQGPSYYILAPDGDILHVRYDDILAVALKMKHVKTFSKLRLFGKYFEDVYLPEGQGLGGRFVPSGELQNRYPDDLQAGVAWSEMLSRGSSTA